MAKTQVARRHETYGWQQGWHDLVNEEHFPTRANCTPEQCAWEDAFQMLKPSLLANCDAPPLAHLVLAFRPSHHASNPKLRVDGFNARETIHAISQVTVVTLGFIAAAHWQAPLKRQYRANWMEHRLRVDSSGLLLAATATDDAHHSKQLWQKDALRPPRRDQYAFWRREHSQQLVGDSDPVLKAPFKGRFTLQKNERHINLCVRDLPVFRLRASDARWLQLHEHDAGLVKCGTRVAKGDPLGRLTGSVMYGELSTRYVPGQGPQPVIYYADDPDVLLASPTGRSRCADNLQLATAMLRQVGLVVTDDPDQPEMRPSERCAPADLIELLPSDVEVLTNNPGWDYTSMFQRELLAAMRPGAASPFFANATVTSTTQLSAIEEETDTSVLHYSNGETQSLPSGVRVLPSVLGGAPVPPGSPIADWVRREEMWHTTWQQLLQVPYLPVIAAAFLVSRAILPGTRGYRGDKLLVPTSLLPEDLWTASCARFVDFLPAEDYLTDAGTYVLPPVQFSHWSEHIQPLVINGIGYHAYPTGDRFSETLVDSSSEH